ncbi:MAG: DUF87 domain-containing protein [Patescibacteria group bacterium]
MDKNLDRVLLEVKTSRSGEESPEAMVQFLSSLVSLRKRLLNFFPVAVPVTLEVGVIDQLIHFYISCPATLQAFIESQLVSQYPKALIMKIKDPLPEILKEDKHLSLAQMGTASGYLYPIRTYRDFKEVDPMSSLIAVLSKAKKEDRIWVQVLLIPIGNSWQRKGERSIASKPKDSAGVVHQNPYSKVIAEKIKLNGFKTAIRIAISSDSKERSRQLQAEITNSFSSYNNPSGNSFILRRALLWQRKRMITGLIKRNKRFVPSNQILNVEEIATFFHFPTEKFANLHNISWHKTILSEPPQNLPVAEYLTSEEKGETNFFAITEFKNKPTVFGIKDIDRRKHFYLIGKTGSGKSTLIANMAINDIRNKKGVCVIDPHGDLCEILLNYIPSYRVNDIVYLDPADTKQTFALNPLTVENPEQKELVVSGIVAIFHKLYGHTWGPRLEYILRNALLTVISLPDSTLLMVQSILTDENFRRKVVEKMQDRVLRNYWVNEFEQMQPRLRSESISPILNKVGQFTSSNLMRNIIKSPKSTINLENIMDEGKIVIMNLSQGRIGEDNAALLGAMMITKIQLAAMNRVSMAEEKRKDFYLYVDEFQNFATTSFIKILSEARKYRLNLILANQYISQVPEDVRAAIFGNVGTMMSFLVGAQDSAFIGKEFGERFKPEDLLLLGNYQAIVKLSVDGITQAPFLSTTLPLPKSATQNREKVIRVSKEKYTRPV